MGVKTKLVGAALAAAITLGITFEGTERVAAPDPLGIPTACHGHTGRDVYIGRVYTDAECRALLEADLNEAYGTVQRCFPGIVDRSDKEKVAWTLFTLNMGPGGRGVKDGFCALKDTGAPPTLLRKLRAGDFEGACKQLPYWDNPKNLRGLRIRRQKEMELCLEGVYGHSK